LAQTRGVRRIWSTRVHHKRVILPCGDNKRPWQTRRRRTLLPRFLTDRRPSERAARRFDVLNQRLQQRRPRRRRRTLPRNSRLRPAKASSRTVGSPRRSRRRRVERRDAARCAGHVLLRRPRQRSRAARRRASWRKRLRQTHHHRQPQLLCRRRPTCRRLSAFERLAGCHRPQMHRQAGSGDAE
jgi:hypothetical protein